MSYRIAFFPPRTKTPAFYTGTKFTKKGKPVRFRDRNTAALMLARLARNHAVVKRHLLRGHIFVTNK